MSVSVTEVEVRPARPFATYRTNLVLVLLCTWFTVGLFLDAWAHNTVPDLETFFTPWHAVFYSGFIATAAWVAWTLRGARHSGRQAVPVGYGWTAVAVVGFGISGIGDFLWHTAFGIEQHIDILFSPTHLGLITTMLVIVTTPLRSAWADPALPAASGTGRLFPAVLSTALAATLVLLFLQYSNALTFTSRGVVFGLSNQDEGFTAGLMGSVAVTNLVLLVPLLTLALRWTLPFGAATITYAAAAGLSGAIRTFDNWKLLAGVLVAGVAVDVLARWLRPGPGQPVAFRVFAGATPLITWALYVASAYLTAPDDVWYGFPEGVPHEVVELYTGAPVVQALIGLLVASLLGANARRPEPRLAR